MIQIEGVRHSAGGKPILHGISLEIPKGGVTALIGPNGAGKSTLLALMARLEPLQAGRISFDGLDVTRTSGRDLALKLAILRQDTPVSTRLTVSDLVGFGRFPHHRGRPRSVDAEVVAQAIAAFDLEDLAGRFIDELSGGERQRALVAMAFAQETDYLLLDEPLNNLDMPHARALMRRLREAADTHGRTVVIVVHEINYAAAHADRIVAMRDGEVVLSGEPSEIVNSAALQKIFGMDARVTTHEGRPLVLHHI